MSTQDEARRKFRRKSIVVEIRLRDETGDGEIQFDTADLSLGGAFLKSELLLEPDERIEIEINTPEGVLLLRARVVRTVRSGDQRSGPGMGIEFVELDHATRNALKKVLS